MCKLLASETSSLEIFVNQQSFLLHNCDPRRSLVNWLRSQPGLTGTKTMCESGSCGSCTVTISDGEKHYSANSCLVPLGAVNGCYITTVEGIGSSRNGFHAIQQRLADFNGSQCGYCSPGIVMAMYSMLSETKELNQREIESMLDGNVCRCTGYRPIMDAMKTFAKDADDKILAQCKDIEDCTPCYNVCQSICDKTLNQATEYYYENANHSLHWYKPITLQNVIKIYKKYPENSVKLLMGHTGEAIYSERKSIQAYIELRCVKELKEIKENKDFVEIGAAVTLSIFIDTLYKLEHESSTFVPMATHLKKVSNLSIRNVASWSGNLVLKIKHKEFPSDIFTILVAAGAKVLVLDIHSAKTELVEICSNAGSLINLNMDGKLILKMILPKFKSSISISHHMKTFKIAPKSMNSLAYLNAAFRVSVADGIASNCVFSFGEINSRACKTEEFINGKKFNQSVFNDALGILSSEIKPYQHSLTDASIEYKLNVALGCFYKFFLSMVDNQAISSSVKSILEPLKRDICKSSIEYPQDKNVSPVAAPIPKLSAKLQVSGEAYYSSDKLPSVDELYAVLVKSKIANAYIDVIDTTKAEKLSGCRFIIHGTNFPSKFRNNWHPKNSSYKIVAETHVEYAGQPIAVVIADSAEEARIIADSVEVTYKDHQPPILTIDDAIKHKNFFSAAEDVVQGDAETAIKNADVQISGETDLGSQYHMYMELQYARATPTDSGGFNIEVGTQRQQRVQQIVADITGSSCNKINVITKRIGGAFGGKATNSLLPSCVSALGAFVSQRSVRYVATMADCMETYGMRSRYKIKYKIGANRDGKVVGVDCTVYADSGCSDSDGELNHNFIVMNYFDSAYFCPNRVVKSVVCKTNLPSTTWFRCPGQLQATGFVDLMMEHVACELGMNPLELKEKNLYTEGKIAFNGKQLTQCHTTRIVDDLVKKCSYEKRKLDIDKYNADNKWRKKGIAIAPVKYYVETDGAAYTAQVAIYETDGSVCVSHGGIECGQGINTKVAQVVALELGIDMSLISVESTQTLTSPNSSKTGGAVTSEHCCVAVAECCKILKKRIDSVCEELNENVSWSNAIALCANQNIDLLASYKNTPSANETYNVYAVAVSEVDLDVLTGEHQVSRVDILYDCGRSLNPAIDIGQIEGAFVMAMGFWLGEKIIHEPETGRLLTNSMWTYHVPTAADIPNTWNIELLNEVPTKTAFMRSKTAGEPPICIAVSTFSALKYAMMSYKQNKDNISYFNLDSPATVEDVYLKFGIDPLKEFIL